MRQEDHSIYQIKELLRISEMGKVKDLKMMLNNKKFPNENLDECLRKCINKYDKNRPEYIECIKELIKFCDINYSNSVTGETPLMVACAKGEIEIIDIFLKIPTKIQLDKVDKDKKNFVHHILNKNTNESDAIKIIEKLFEYNTANLKAFPTKSITKRNPDFLVEKDKDGEFALSLILKKGWSEMLKEYFKNVAYKKYTLPNGNNLVHRAVEGKSMSCLKQILSYASADELNDKNKEGLTPSNLAKKNNNYLFEKILDSFENNISNKTYKELLLTEKKFNTNDILTYFYEKNYKKSLSMLLVYRINKSILNETSPNLPCEWNIMLNKKMCNDDKGISEEKIFTKLLNSSSESNFYVEIANFFQKYLKEFDIIDHIDQEGYPIDIVIYNCAIFNMKIGNFERLFKIVHAYFTHILIQNEKKYYKFIMVANLILLSAEVLIIENEINVAIDLLEKFESYVKKNQKKISNEGIEDSSKTSSYLEDNEVFNQFSPLFYNEIICYICLLKYLCRIDRKFLTDFKAFSKNFPSDTKNKIINKLRSLYIMIKIKKNFQLNVSTQKCFDKLLTNEKLFFSSSSESKMFYYNTLGILNLKLKNYSLAETMFRVALGLSRKSNSTEMQRVYFIYYIKFNLALSLFYQKNFEASYELLKEISQNNLMKENGYVWFRLGLCSLEIHFSKLTKEKEMNEVILKVDNYQKKNHKQEEKEIIEELCDKDGKDKLYEEFQCEYEDVCNKLFLKPQRRPQTQKIYLHHHTSPPQSEYLSQAIYSFQRVVLINSNLLKKNDNSQLFNEILQKNFGKGNENTQQKSSGKSIIQEVMISTYFNLLFCLSLSEKWLEILLVLNKMSKEKFQVKNDFKYKCIYFKIEALVNLGRINEASNSVIELINLSQNDNFKVDLYNKMTHNIINDAPFKIGLTLGLITILCKKRNFSDAEEKFKNLLEAFFKGKNNVIPSYILNIGIYIFLSQGKNGINKALKLIKVKTLDFAKKRNLN